MRVGLFYFPKPIPIFVPALLTLTEKCKHFVLLVLTKIIQFILYFWLTFCLPLINQNGTIFHVILVK